MESGDLGDDHDEVSGVGGDSTHSGLLRAALTRRSALLGIGAVTGVAAVDVGGFAYLGRLVAARRAEPIPVRRRLRRCFRTS
jgi:catalase